MLKNYRLGFEFWGLILFLIIIIPNFIYFAFLPLYDIFQTNSITETIDKAAFVSQIFMIISLCFLKNIKSKKVAFTPLIIIAVCFCLLYFTSFLVYYAGIINGFVILGLTIPPCLAFLFFALDRKNYIALIFILFFTICHLIYAVVNFII